MNVPDEFDAAAAKVAGQPTDADPIDQAAAQVVQGQRTTLRSSLYGALLENPDVAARAQKLGRKTGLPADVVGRNLPEVERNAKLDEFDQLLQNSPVVAQWLADQNNAKVAHDDVGNMSEHERLFREALAAGRVAQGRIGETYVRPTDNMRELDRSIVQAFTEPVRRGFAQGRRGLTLLLNDLGVFDGLQRQRDAARTAAGLAPEGNMGLAVQLADQQRQVERFPTPAKIAQGMQDISQSATFSDALSAVVRNPAAVLETALQSVGASAPALVGAMAGSTAGPVGTATGAGLGSFAVEYGNTLQDVMAERGVDARDALAISRALANPELMAEAREKAVKRGLPVAAFDALTAGLAGRLLAGAKPTVTSVVTRSAGELGLQAGGGAAGEAVAQAATGEYKPGDILMEALAELPSAIVEVPGNYRDSMIRAKSAEQRAQVVEQLNNLAAASKVRERDVDTFEQFIAQAAENGSVQHVYIDANTLMQSGMAEQLAQVSPSVAAQLQTAVATGAEIQIPVAEYTARIAGNEFAQSLVDDIRVEGEQFTRREAQEYMQNQAGELQAEVERVLAEKQNDEVFKASAETVKAEIKSQLDTVARFTPQVNDAYASMVGNFYAVMGAKIGATPEEVFAKYPLRVQAEAVQSGPVLEQGGVSLADVLQQWDDAGIKNAVSERNKTIAVSQIVVPESERGSGKGTAAMQALVDYADRTGQRIALTPSSDFGGNKKRLVEFYKRFGFVENKGRSRDFTTTESMLRPAKQLNQSAQSQPLPATIEIDGKQRPTTNSNGQPIAATEEGGSDSADIVSAAKTGKAVSLKVYHGTAGVEFDTFRPRTARAVWFAPDAGYAKKYADSRQGENRRVIAATVNLKNPLVIDMKGRADPDMSKAKGALKYANTIEDIAGVAQQWGHDGVIFKNRKVTDEGFSANEVAVFDPMAIVRDLGAGDEAVVRYTGNAKPSPAFKLDSPLEQAATSQSTGGTSTLNQSAQSQPLPATIEVDGKQRPTTNSNGQPIAATEEGVRNFWKWFGDSKVVDAEGKPLVVYHGTASTDITEFRPRGGRNGEWQDALSRFKAAQVSNARVGYMAFRDGSFFSPKADYAGNYTREGKGVMYPVYVKAENPVFFNQVKRGDVTGVDAKKTPDALIMHTDGDVNEVAVIDPTQIKSAIGNSGEFDPANPNILMQSAYHGTPHRGIDKFSTDKIGTGEGAQAYGWGLYFASKREIAEWYRNSLTAPKINGVKMNGRKVDTGTPVYHAVLKVVEAGGQGTREEVIAHLQERAQAYRSLPDQFRRQAANILGLREVEGALKKVVAAKSFAVDMHERNPGQLYEVDIPEDSTMLLWDKPLSEQSAEVRGKVARIFKEYVEPTVETYWTLDGERLDTSDPDFSIVQKIANQGYDAVLADAQSRVESRASRPENDPLRKAADAVLTRVKSLQGRGVDQVTRTLEVVESDVTGQALYRGMERKMGGDKAASEALAALGIKGIKYLDGTSRGAGDGSFNYVVFSGDDVAITNQFYQTRGANRGSFNPSTNTITLLKNADLSTFLHEAGHFFLEVQFDIASRLAGMRTDGASLSEGEQQIVDDADALLKWFGVESVSEWYSLDFEEKRGYHEKFARGFEAYLFEGKAPSIELNRIFQTFRGWLTQVYRNIVEAAERALKAAKADSSERAAVGKALDVQLSDEVRAVMDRMLATNEEIRLAEQARSMLPLFESPEQAGMTPEEFAAYQALGTQATADAIQDVQARTLRDLSWTRNARGREIKRLQKQSAELRREVQMQARREVMSQPIYRAWQFLTGKLDANDKLTPEAARKSDPNVVDPSVDSLFTAIAKLGGLSKGEVVSQWGTDPKDKPASGVFGKPVWRREGGRSIDSMAETLGELGYLPLDENGKTDIRDLEERFDSELRGSPVYSNRYDYGAQQEQRAGDGINVEALGAGRFDLTEIKVMGLPTEVVDRIQSLKMTGKVGLHPDIVAERFGFTSGDELVRTLATTESPKAAIEGLTDARMLEQYGELATPEAIERAADRAIHNEARARFVATEANALAKATGERKILASAAREFARNMIARLKVRDIRPSQYAIAEARAAKGAIKASRSGDLVKAAAEKRNQLVNNYATRAAYDAQDEVERITSFFRDVVTRPDDRVGKTRDMDVVNAARAVLSNFGYAGKAKTALEYLEAVKEYDPATYDVLAASVRTAEEMATPDIRDLTVEQLRALHDEVQSLWHLAKRNRQMEVDGDLLDREDVAADINARMVEFGIPDTAPGESSAITPAEKRLLQIKGVRSILRRVESWVDQMDGSNKIGAFRRGVFNPVKLAADKYRAAKIDALRQFRDSFNSIAGTMKRATIYAPELGYTFGKDEGGVALNEILHAILHTGNDSNKRKLLLGRGWAEDVNGTLDTRRWDAFIARMVAEGKLKREHFDFAQSIWDLMESTKPLAQKAHRDAYGKYFSEVTAQEFVDPFGVVRRGGYVPAQVDSRIVQDNELRKLLEEGKEGMAYAFPATNKGFTNSRVEYNRPLLLDLRTLPQHIDKVLLFSYMEMPVRDVTKLLTMKNVRGPLNKIDPTAISHMLMPWLNRSARQQVTTPVPGDAGMSRFFNTLRNRTSMATMFANLSNTAQQITGFSLAAVKVKPRHLLAATAQWISKPRQLARTVAEQSTYMSNRMSSEVDAMLGEIEAVLLDPTLYQRGQEWTKRHTFFMQSAFDNVMGPIIWTGAFNEALEQGYSDKDAVHIADSVVRQTQGSTLPEDVSRIETGPAWARIFTQFAGYFNMQANLLGTEFAKVAKEMGLRKGATRGLYIFVAGFYIPALVAEAIAQAFRGGPGDDDDDGEYLDDWLMATLVYGPMRNVTAFVPFAGQVVNSAVARFNGNPVDDRVSVAPVVGALEGVAGVPVDLYQASFDEIRAQRTVKDVATLISLTTGLPASVAAKPIGYLAGVASDKIDPTGEFDFARGLVTGVASPESRGR